MYDGQPEHEVWRVYEGRIEEDWPSERESFGFVDPDTDTEQLARWLPAERLRDHDATFYAPEVLDALDA